MLLILFNFVSNLQFIMFFFSFFQNISNDKVLYHFSLFCYIGWIIILVGVDFILFWGFFTCLNDFNKYFMVLFRNTYLMCFPWKSFWCYYFFKINFLHFGSFVLSFFFVLYVSNRYMAIFSTSWKIGSLSLVVH